MTCNYDMFKRVTINQFPERKEIERVLQGLKHFLIICFHGCADFNFVLHVFLFNVFLMQMDSDVWAEYKILKFYPMH